MIGPRDRRPPTAGTWYPYSTQRLGDLRLPRLLRGRRLPRHPRRQHGRDARRTWPTSSSTPTARPTAPGAASGPPTATPRPTASSTSSSATRRPSTRTTGAKFRPIAEAIWAKDPAIILVVGDFAYGKVIDDPYQFEGGAAVELAGRAPEDPRTGQGAAAARSGSTSTSAPTTRPSPHGLRPERSYIEQLGKIAPGAKYKVVIFEYNSGNHAHEAGPLQRPGDERGRADRRPPADRLRGELPPARRPERQRLGPGPAVPRTRRRSGSSPRATSPGWPAAHYQPLLVASEVRGRAETLSVNAKRSEDGKTLVLQVVNWGDEPRPTRIEVEGFTPSRPVGDGRGTGRPARRRQHRRRARPDQAPAVPSGRTGWQAAGELLPFPPRSITIIRLE